VRITEPDPAHCLGESAGRSKSGSLDYLRFEVAHGFRVDLAHLSDSILAGGETFCTTG